jgi:pre-mRNA-splicing factor 18
MSKEISKAKGSSPTPETEDKKYVKRAELEAARLAAYNAEQERLRQEREERLAQKRKHEEVEADRRREREEKKRRLAEESKRRKEEEAAAKERERRKRLGLSEEPALSGENGSNDGVQTADADKIEPAELTKRLRELGQPVRLFGESEKGRMKRYNRLIGRDSTPQRQITTDGPIPTTLSLLPESEMKVPDQLPKDEEGLKYLFRQLASYFTMVLKEWDIALSKRDDAVKQTFQGKQAYNAMVQSRENMKPLFRLFEKGEVEEGILEPVVEIVRHAQNRRYVDANDAYLRLSIGKA